MKTLQPPEHVACARPTGPASGLLGLGVRCSPDAAGTAPRFSAFGDRPEDRLCTEFVTGIPVNELGQPNLLVRMNELHARRAVLRLHHGSAANLADVRQIRHV